MSWPPYAEMDLLPVFDQAISSGVLTLEECLVLQGFSEGGWTLASLLKEPQTRLAALSVLVWQGGLPPTLQ